MAFNLQGFGAGFASKLTDRIDEERVRSENLQDEARRTATQVRLRKQAERSSEQKRINESMGLLSMLGYTSADAERIANGGKSAVELATTVGQKALTKGVDPSTIFNFPSVGGELTEKSTEVINGTIDAAKPKKLGGFETTKDDGSGFISGTSINLENYKNLFAEPDKVESTFSARLAVISQNLARNPERSDAAELKAEQEKLLADLATMKEAERENKGETTESYTLGSVSTAVREVRAASLSRFGFKLGLNDTIDNMETGQEHLSDIANLNAVSQLTTRNSSIQSEAMSFAIRGLYDSTKVGLADYVFEKNSSGNVTQVTPNEFTEKAKARQYRTGEVFKDDNNLYVYTGYTDPYTNMPFMIFPMGQ